MVRASYGLTFEASSPVERSQHLRADVALFVGHVAPRRRDPVDPAERRASERFDPDDERHLRAWLHTRRFIDDIKAFEDSGRSVAALVQVPVPVESWAAFDRLFAWDARSGAAPGRSTTYLGAAVRAFFAQGGHKAYVVRAGDPWPQSHSAEDMPEEEKGQREARLWHLVPDAAAAPPGEPVPSALDQRTWRGITHLFGLEDVAFVLVPDLPDLFDVVSPRNPRDHRPAAGPEVFVTCDEERTDPGRLDEPVVRVEPPACDEASLRGWAQVVAAAAAFVRRYRREAMLIAAIPLLLVDEGKAIAADSPLPRLPLGRALELAGFASAFVQLATPWVRTDASANCPGGVEPPDGTVAGVLARNARARGTFRSAAGLDVPFVHDLLPQYGRSALHTPVTQTRHGLVGRVTVIGRAPGGIELLSDVTTSLDEAYRHAGASRLLGALLRAARAIGEDLTFEVSDTAMWARVRRRFADMMLQLWEAGALRGRSPDEAFEVRCDRTTMSQADLDSGRLIVELRLEIAAAIESIHVTLALSEGGRVALHTAGNR